MPLSSMQSLASSSKKNATINRNNTFVMTGRSTVGHREIHTRSSQSTEAVHLTSNCMKIHRWSVVKSLCYFWCFSFLPWKVLMVSSYVTEFSFWDYFKMIWHFVPFAFLHSAKFVLSVQTKILSVVCTWVLFGHANQVNDEVECQGVVVNKPGPSQDLSKCVSKH
jgi:hypothetical protein